MGYNYSKFTTKTGYKRVVLGMGFDSIKEFEKTTGKNYKKLKGKVFQLSHNKVYIWK